MKVGIITYHRAVNYGAYLQACALCNRMNEEPDISAEIIDFHMEKEKKEYNSEWPVLIRLKHPKKYRFIKKRQEVFARALNDPLMKKSEDYCCSDQLRDFKEFVQGKYDAIIAGSDEVWNFNNFRGFPNPYWLIGDLKCRKFAYAASSRQDFHELSDENRQLIHDTLLQYSFIGVRDELTKTELEDLVPGVDIHVCCDPTFVYDFQLKKKKMSDLVHGKKGYDPNKPTAVIMSANHSLNCYLYNKLHMNYNLISVARFSPRFINIPDATPSEWMDIVNNADLFFTTFFHGTCFGIITKTPFLSFGSTTKSGKLQSVLLNSGLEDHYIEEVDSFIKNDMLMNAINQLTDPAHHHAFMQKCDSYLKQCREDFSQSFLAALRD